MAEALLDTDTLSMIMRRHPVIFIEAQTYLSTYQRFNFSIITQYEVLRGLKAKRATRRESDFRQACLIHNILPLTEAVVIQASDIYAELYRRGDLIGDADILIAATALVNGLPLITNNETYFKRISGLIVQNWLKQYSEISMDYIICERC